jgi:hypothetical protein
VRINSFELTQRVKIGSFQYTMSNRIKKITSMLKLLEAESVRTNVLRSPFCLLQVQEAQFTGTSFKPNQADVPLIRNPMLDYTRTRNMWKKEAKKEHHGFNAHRSERELYE